ncbi:DNA-binding transcriptional LysR family regulator [Variovorax boronicumulans]|jgi:DNA-binding transcriptional LysR family regulator|uniref:DNA-binding transcriptional LysR family regulator n=1 Tax=Variovorax boronicumulans TaxID=436515 RepID=A0AAW8D9K8_9BURK|nr:LysR family transcriptional regulator [Variovorax boronicumulans]MDP9896561.1 DNA-binding transcriptional LysR family regulator [Variovorax boronicumulans]MDQ0043996.1 DNA-binding transcriptional LysR family regulator [Variovorax boronicumulans]MDQ0056656.1 DNA-binding transcriptional LysR family regulator [Variovorax boronicumulans]MDQ0071434.1 DNA-binding transcriptional LysR family regulator [Variovorax boronicumulans]
MNENFSPTFSPTIRQLRAFLAVHQLRKLSAAAQRLFVTQSAVSMLIRQLEEGLGTRLFDRTTRSLKPTAAANEMLPVAERILRDVDSLSTGFRELTTLERGRVSVAITPTLATFLLPDAIRSFSQEHPKVRVLVNDCAPDQFISRILGEHVDFGIGTPERPGAEVEVERLMRDHLALVCRDDHPLAKARVVRWTDLAGHPLITVRAGYGVRPLIDGTAADAGVALDVVNEVSFLSSAIWMTAIGMGASIMPSAFARAADDPSLVVKVLSAPRVSRDISLVIKRGHSLSVAARAFIEAIKKSL